MDGFCKRRALVEVAKQKLVVGHEKINFRFFFVLYYYVYSRVFLLTPKKRQTHPFVSFWVLLTAVVDDDAFQGVDRNNNNNKTTQFWPLLFLAVVVDDGDFA